MEQNLILAGVGGQGILTIARAISIAALQRGLVLKQAEVHGMSQRGGAVQSHLRLSSRELFSDLIPLGQADIVLSVEPLESLRYTQYLSNDGVVVASTNAFVNIDNYPAVEQTLDRISEYPRHVLLDADGLAKKAGSARSANIVMLGAASLFLEIGARELEDAVAEMFGNKGPAIIETNRRAFRIGRNAATAYREGLSRGANSRTVREWIDAIPIEELAQPEAPTVPGLIADQRGDGLSGAESQAFEHTLVRVYEEGRKQLYEHEVYKLVELVGAISPPQYLFIPKGGMISPEALAGFPGERVVLKIVSPNIVHKTEASGIAFVAKEHGAVKREIDRMVARHSETAKVEGVLVVEFVERQGAGFGNELFVGVRATREFGPVIAAGLGGVDTEYLATKMKPGIAVAKACAMDITAEQFLELFKHTAAYDILAGRTRGRERIVSDGELLRCFRAFISIAARFCVDRGEVGPDIAELEVNPFTFRQQRMIPLDGRGRLGTATYQPMPRPIERVRGMLEPRAIAVLGVSKSSMNFGRIILNNIKNCGFPQEHLYVVKDGEQEIDGVQCVADVAALPEMIDLLVIAAPAAAIPQVVDEVVASRKVGAAIMIPGGMGETEGSEEIQRQTRDAVLRGRETAGGGPVFLGPNCMGIQSRIGRYDTFFIPSAKLDNRWSAPARRVALVSQSGAFIITRLSNLETLDPAIAVSLGNQIDLTLADLLLAVCDRDDIDALGVYAEGFTDVGGLEFIRAVRQTTATGKTVVFYKAGRTSTGRSAAAGHTASVAGDYDVCQAAVEQAGAIVVETFKEFEQVVEIATDLHDKHVGGRRIAAISNAGYETVGMADNISGQRYRVEMPALSDESRQRLESVLTGYKLNKLVNARNPLDLTPMATDEAYEQCVRVMLESPEMDAVLVSVVPLSPAMLTTPDEITRPGSLAERLPRLFAEARKPVVVSIDSGSRYDALAGAIRAAGVPVFRSCDQAIRSLGRYLCHRSPVVEVRATSAEDAACGGLEQVVGETGCKPSARPVRT
ncbi:MAG: indolepyruvate oxidoreductase subunit beta [Planctomycetota bacterium]